MVQYRTDALEALRGRSTCSVEEAGKALGIGRQLAYRMAARYLETRGAEGLPCLRFGRLLVVPVPKLFEMIGADRSPEGVS